MDSIKCKVWVTIIATVVAVVFIILNYFTENLSRLWLSIEVIILPSIYIIGSVISERIIKKEYDAQISYIGEETDKLTKKYLNQIVEIERLKYDNDLLRERLKNGK